MSTIARPLTGDVKDPPPPTRDAQDLKRALTLYQGRFAELLPKHVTPERVVTLALIAATKTPELYRCSKESIVLSIMRIASWGLEIGTTAHLVPFKDSKSGQFLCTPIPDYRGVCEMLLRPHHGQRHVRDIFARCVYEGEHFRVRFGSDESIEHEPTFGAPTRKVTHVYAIAKLPHNRWTFEVLSREEVEAIRQRSRSKDSPAWKDHWPEMAKKTAIKRLSKRLPMYGVPTHAQLADAFETDDDVDDSPLAPTPTEQSAADAAPNHCSAGD
jgi:recombination protein RecT